MSVMPHDEGNIVFGMSLQSSLLMPHDEGKHFLNEILMNLSSCCTERSEGRMGPASYGPLNFFLL